MPLNKKALQLSVIIVNYNVKYFLEQCLCSVLNALKNVEAEIIVVDNDSTDGSQQFFSKKFAGVHFIWNWKNVGFAKANNAGLQQAKGKYILFLNPDTLVPEDCFEKCLSFFKMQKDAGALGIRMIDGAGKFLKESKRGFPGLLPSFYKLSGLAALFPYSKTFARYYAGNLPENENHMVDVIAGAFMLVEKNVLDKTGAFDEQFFMYGEDIDLSCRIQKAGYKNYYFSEATIIHFKGESTKKESLKYVEVFYGAMTLFVSKHYSGLKAALYNVFIQIAIWLKVVAIFSKKLFFLIEKNKIIIKPSPSPTLIVAGEEDYLAVIELLKNSNTNLQIIRRVDPTPLATAASLGNFKDLTELIKKYMIGNIIFCINELQAQEIISIIQKINLRLSYQFHAAGSVSIVSSSNKNEGGDSIAPNKNAPTK